MNTQLKHLAYNLKNSLTTDHPILLLAPSTPWAEYWRHNLHFWLPKNYPIYWFNDWETLPYDQYSPHPNLIGERLRTLAELPTRQHGIVITTIAAIAQRLAPQTHLDRHGIHLSIGDQQPRDTLIQRLINAGYQPTAHINAKGEYATRGAIVDLYPLNASHPIRLEWLDNQIDSIREFNLDDQTTHQKHQSLSLLPTSELDLTQTGRTCFRQSARQQLGENIIHSPLYQRISDGETLQGLEYYLPLFFDDTASLFDYLPPNTHLISPTDPQPALEKHHNYCQKRYQRLNALRQNQLLPPEALWFSPNVIQTHLNSLPTQPYHPSADNIDFSGDEHDREQQWLKQIHHPSKPLFLHFTSQGNREHWLEKLQKQKLNPQLLDITPPFEEQSPTQLTLIQSPLQYSFHSPHATHLAESDLHAGHQTPNFRQSKNPHAGAQIESLQTLSLGAPIVHIDHGVGRYQGLTRLSPESDELMRIEYAKGSTLYVPITDLDLITRYSGANPETAPLHELGGKQWQTSKRKIQQSVHDTASELLEIYAQRENAQGIAIDYDPQDLQQFADNFPYEETPDQTQAIQTVLSDLRSERPMDRIICGDVGFGKTEVAVRAAYASVLGGQQVALIAPTTLLANQHYHHFLDRLADYSLTIDLVSRFKSAAEQKASLERLKNGQTDLIIGTHRLLQKDVQFANLGLVIIDEEQRFGVRHKERLKSLRANVNLLTLTATPIPRTLNLALSGLRDLSIIATPPSGRQSVQTIISEWHLPTIEEACERELRRGGQIYLLHNDIDSIERIARTIADNQPNLRIAIVHGQMPERQLEQIMQDFYNRHYDLLIATTIIESGIDIPNANTILINRADKLGLAQLHQLRGRVGRSHHQAYAYLFTPSWQTLGKDAQRRLEAFISHDSLGAGYLLASQDLDIRGAGEILGSEQSGQIQQIGVHYYFDLLERAVEALKNGQPPQELSEPNRLEIEFSEPALLPANYIYDPQIRLSYYQRLATSKTHSQIDTLTIELINRFGSLPPAARHLIAHNHLRLQAKTLGITRLHIHQDHSEIQFNDQPNLNTNALFQRLQNDPAQYKMRTQNSLSYHPDPSPETLEQQITHTQTLLDAITP